MRRKPNAYYITDVNRTLGQCGARWTREARQGTHGLSDAIRAKLTAKEGAVVIHKRLIELAAMGEAARLLKDELAKPIKRTRMSPKVKPRC